MSDRTKSHRCSTCDVCWPHAQACHVCPRCRNATEPETVLSADYTFHAAARIAETWRAWYKFEAEEDARNQAIIDELEAQFASA